VDWDNTNDLDESPLAESLLAALLLPPALLLIYGLCGWYTHARNFVPILRFDWETHIPFIPQLVIPYLSLHTLLIAAIFFCATRTDLRILLKRTTLVTLLSAVGFILLPLGLEFPNANQSNLFAEFCEFVEKFDPTFNRFPSLHVSLAIVVWSALLWPARGRIRWAIHAWLFLIVLSTLFIHRHHVPDLLGGLATAAMAFLLVKRRPLEY
jgi:hypothetical protein